MGKSRKRRSRKRRSRRGGSECMKAAIAKCAEGTKALGIAKVKARAAPAAFAKKYAKGLAAAEKGSALKLAAMKKGRADIIKKGSLAARMAKFQGGKRKKRRTKRRRKKRKSRKSKRKKRRSKRRRKSKKRKSRKRRR